MILLFMACAPVLRYEPVLWETPPAPPPSIVQAALATDLARGRIPSLTANGEPIADPAALPDPIAWAAWWTGGRRDRGVELDLRLDGLAVEVVRGLDGASRIRWSDAPVSPVEGSADDLRARFGVLAVDGDAHWQPDELGQIAIALGLLSAQELALVDDVQLWRTRASPRRPRDELAWYDPTVRPVRIEVYDQAFVDEGSGFVGTPERPFGPAVSTVLHELGHALADSPIRRAYEGYRTAAEGGADGAELGQAWSRYREAERADAVLSGWRAVWFPPGPSTYGRRSPAESFAEAFMLFHADPAALRRVAPAAASWMARDRPAALAGGD